MFTARKLYDYIDNYFQLVYGFLKVGFQKNPIIKNSCEI
jgi:hypothetical protein